MRHRRPRSSWAHAQHPVASGRASPAKRRALAKLDEQKRRATQTVAKELVPKLEAAQAEHDQQVAALTGSAKEGSVWNEPAAEALNQP